MKRIFVEVDDKNKALLESIQNQTGYSIKQCVLEGMISLAGELEIIEDRMDFLAHGVVADRGVTP